MKSYKIQITVSEDLWTEFCRLAVKEDIKPNKLILKLIERAINECDTANL